MFDRHTEIERYKACYADPTYKMGVGRLVRAREVLQSLAHEYGHGGWLLDVGAGRGEIADFDLDPDFTYVGIDPVDLNHSLIKQGVATDLSQWYDESFDVVVSLDCLEHLVPEDVVPALIEMNRVCNAEGTLFLTANSDPSIGPDGMDLHISKRPETEWHQLFVEVFAGRSVENIGMVGVSPGWLIS